MQTAAVHVVGENGVEVALNAHYVDAILTLHPEAKVFVSYNNGPAVLKTGDEVVGIVMPIRGAAPSKEFIGELRDEAEQQTQTGIRRYKAGDVVGHISSESAAEMRELGFDTQESDAIIPQRSINHIDKSHRDQLTDTDIDYLAKTINEPTEILPNLSTAEAPYRSSSVLMVRKNGKDYVSIVEITKGDKDNIIWNFWKMDRPTADKYLEKFRKEKAQIIQSGGRPLPHIPRNLPEGKAGKPEGLSGSQTENSSLEGNIPPENESVNTTNTTDDPFGNERGSIDLRIFGGPQLVAATRKLVNKINPKAAQNITVQEGEKDLGFVRAVLLSPNRIGEARYYVVHGKNAMLKQERLRGMVQDKMNEVFGKLNKEQIREFEALAWMGDTEGVNYTAADLNEMGVSDSVKTAYLAQRKFHGQVWRMLKAHRKAYGADTEGMTGKAGHVPHFFENWNVYEMVDVEREGKAGSIEMVKEPAGIVGTFRSLSQATDFANALDPQKQYTIKPKAFRLPDDMVARTVLKDSSYFKMVDKVEKEFSLNKDEAHEMVQAVARRKNRRRTLGSLMKRKGQTGFRRDGIRDILTEYYNGVARYIALDDFKARVVPKFERDFGVELGRAGQALRHKNVAAYVEDYINDLNGVPGRIEAFLNAAILQSPFGKHASSQRPAVWTVNKLMHATSILKLGLFNLSAGVVNLIQLTNAFSQVPVKEFAWAFGKVIGGRLTGSERRLLKRMGVEYDLGLSDTGGYSAIHKGGKVVESSLYFFHRAEYLNRAVTGLAAYRTAQAQGMDKREARDYARTLVDKTQFDYSVADTSWIFRNPVGRLAGQFKPYGIKQIEFITGLKGAENIKFWIPMILMAGTFAIPMIEGITDLIEWLTGVNPLTEAKGFLMKWAGDDPAKKVVARTVMYGVAANLNMDISRRVGTGDVLPNRWEDLLGPTISTLKSAKKAMEAGDKTEFVRSLSPSVGNLLTAIETIANDMQVADPYRRDRLKYQASPADVAVKISGFRPVTEAELSDAQNIAN